MSREDADEYMRMQRENNARIQEEYRQSHKGGVETPRLLKDNNVFTRWWNDGLFDGLIVKPWVALWVILGILMCIWLFMAGPPIHHLNQHISTIKAFHENELTKLLRIGALITLSKMGPWAHLGVYRTLLLGALIIAAFATGGSVLGAFIGAKPVMRYWNWRIRKLHEFVHGEDDQEYKGEGSLNFWQAWVFAFMWQMGYREQFRAFKREFQLAAARRVGYS